MKNLDIEETAQLADKLRSTIPDLAVQSTSSQEFWLSLLDLEVRLISISVPPQMGVDLAAGMTQAVTQLSETQNPGCNVALPVALFKDQDTGFYRRSFFVSDYPRYDRGANSIILIRWELESPEAHLECDFDYASAISAVIRTSIRTVDVPVRWSSNEFLILLPRTKVDEAMVVANRINKLDCATGLPEGALSVGVTSAIDGEAFDQVFGRADWAVYSAHVSDDHQVVVG